MYSRVLLYFAILCGVTACKSVQINSKKVLKHVVCFQFKEEVSEEKKVQAIQIFWKLKDQIPQIKKFEGGENISASGLDKGFSHCFILSFENEAARDIYLPHPAHVKVVEENKPLFSDLMVVDIWGEE